MDRPLCIFQKELWHFIARPSPQWLESFSGSGLLAVVGNGTANALKQAENPHVAQLHSPDRAQDQKI